MAPPLHRQIADALRSDIATGVYEPGSELPSERALRDRFDASRNTVRRAIQTLASEGLVTTSAGRPSLVRSGQRWTWPMATWERAHNSIEDAWANSIREQGGEPSAHVTVQVESATNDIAEALQVSAGEHVVARRRVRSVDGEPHQLADSFFPYWVAEQHPVFLEPGDLHAPGGLLAAAGLPQVKFLDALTARMPTPEEARVLQMSAGIPLLIHRRTGYIADSRPVRHMITRMAADRVDLTWELTP